MINNEGECHHRVAHHSDKIKKALADRLNRIEGQIRGINKMITENVYCDDILNQIAAVEAALSGISKILLQEHIRTCVSEQLVKGDTEVVDELIKTIGKLLK